MSIFAVTRRKTVTHAGQWRMLVAILTAAAIAAVIVLAAALLGLSQAPAGGRVPHPEPAPAPPVPRR
jgi:hypothetical protein